MHRGPLRGPGVRQQAVVAELGQRALGGLDLSTLLDDAVVQIARTVHVEYCKVLEFLPGGNALLLRAGVGWKDGCVGHATVGVGTDSQAGYTLLCKEPVIVEDLRTETRFSGPSLLHDHGVVSGLSVIIDGHDQPFGILGAHTTRRRTFTRDDTHFLQAIANVLTAAIERARAEDALVTRTRQLETIRTVTAEIARELDLTTLLNLIVRRATELVGAASGAVYLWDEAGQVLVPQAWQGVGEWMGEVRLGLGEAVAGAVAQRREGLIVHDFPTSPHAHPLFLERAGITAVLGEPLLYHDRLLGVITISNQEIKKPFTEQDRETIALFATEAAIAIENARLFVQVVRAKAEWEHTFDSIPDMVAVLDAEYRLIRVNRALAERLRVAPKELVGQRCYTALHGRETPLPGCPHAQTLVTGRPTTLEIEEPHLGGIFLITTSPLFGAGEQPAVCVHIVRDITEMKRLEEEARQRQRFEDLSRAKSAFIATMSHEFRTPLNSVLGFSELLQEQSIGLLTEKQARYVGHIHESGKHLLNLINDILDVSRAEAGKIELARQPVSLDAIVEATLTLVHPQGEKAGVILVSEIPRGFPPVLADSVRLKQILFNLVSNAIKFTPDGGRVTVTARRIADFKLQIADVEDTGPIPQSAIANLQSEMLEIAVTDTGVGIRPEDLPRLFQEFVQ
ncbi:MAG: GAF domain-containing protein, partial [candidate division NC10 bacterium]|nr:GAF domain-containing protein [candidate division NC10 bacterium]